jgi:uroporphyrinogen III methyltransferase/synthase
MMPVDDHATAAGAGRIVFVGAGPGAADLLTVRGVDVLRRATFVVHDTLVPPAVLALAAATAERRCVTSATSPDVDPGTATGLLLVELARRGGLVVRLKGGDPTVFARLAEELAPLRQAGIPFEIVPGVTAALAAAAAAAMPLTSRSSASSLTILTGHEADAKASAADFATIATLPGTLAVYMGVEQAPEWSRRLMEAGLTGDTPVTMVSRASWPDQRIGSTTLGRCADDIAGNGWQSPAVLIVEAGTVQAACGPLAGRRVLVTRPAGQGEDVASRVRAAGGGCIAVPLVEIAPPESCAALDEGMRHAATYDWIVFSSVNGVQAFVERLRSRRLDARALGTARIAAIGPTTRLALEAAGFVVDLAPTAFRSEGLVEAFAAVAPGTRFLVVRADQSRGVLQRDLRDRGHHVDEVVAYRSRPVTSLDAATWADLDRGVDWVTVTSPSIARAARQVFGDRLSGWRIASLSPVTTAALRDVGIEPTVEAAEATAAALVEAIVAHESRTIAPARTVPSPRHSAGR